VTWWTRNDEDEPDLSSDNDDENEADNGRRGVSSKGKVTPFSIFKI